MLGRPGEDGRLDNRRKGRSRSGRELTSKLGHEAARVGDVLPHKLRLCGAGDGRLEAEVVPPRPAQRESVSKLGERGRRVPLHAKVVRVGGVLPGLALEVVEHGRERHPCFCAAPLVLE